jgi:quinol-cytochrome oxidoreductase complex cytochrome b subunit
LIAFLGYVLPYGQMSLWGLLNLVSNAYFLFYNFIFIFLKEYLVEIININNFDLLTSNYININIINSDH